MTNDVIKFCEQIYREAHLQETTSKALISEFKNIKLKLIQCNLYDQDTIAVYMRPTINRFLSYSLGTFEKKPSEKENNVVSFIIRMSEDCDQSFGINDLKTYLYVFLKNVNNCNPKAGVSYDDLKSVTDNMFGNCSVDFTKAIGFERVKDCKDNVRVVLRKKKLSYNASLDLFLMAILQPRQPNLHLEQLTKEELEKLGHIFKNCLENMIKVSNQVI